MSLRIKPARRVVNSLLTALALAASAPATIAATLTGQTNHLGSTPEILAYNSGHYYPGSNTRDWWRYAGVSGARVFISASEIEPSDDIPGIGDGVTDPASFLARKPAAVA